jgi:hypothetical protein
MKEMVPVISRYDSSTSAPIPTIMSSIPPNKSDIDSQHTITNTATGGNNKTRAANTSVIAPELFAGRAKNLELYQMAISVEAGLRDRS